jgi:outer membrane protein assembly factor BamD
MVEGYDKLGLTQLRDDAKRVLDKNFPGSEYAQSATKKSWWHIW